MPKPAVIPVLLALALAGSAAAAPQPSEAELWVVSASVRESYIDNLFLINEGPGDWVTSGTVSLSYLRRRPPSSFSAYGWVNGSYFGRFDAYSGVKYGFGLSGGNELDRRARVRYSASYTDGINRNALYESRIGAPEIDVKSGWASTGLDYEFTPSTTGRISADASGLHYRLDARDLLANIPADFQSPPVIVDPLDPDAPVPTPADIAAILEALALEGFLVRDLDYWTWHFGAGLSHEFSPRTQASLDLGARTSTSESIGVPDGRLYDASFSLNQQLDPTASLSLGYVYQDADYGTSSQSHTLFTRAQKDLNDRVHGDITVGASKIDAPNDGGSPWNFVGGLGIGVKMKRTSFNAHANRSVYQGIIAGRQQISDDVTLSGGHVFDKDLFAGGYLSYRNAHDTSQDLYSYEQLFGGVTVSIRLSKRFRLAPSYGYAFFSRSQFADSPARSTFGISLRYSKAFK